jgi:Uri superfamily endonuclease
MIPAVSGAYVLVLGCRRARTIRVGRRGEVRLRVGWYVYAGSAFGPGGLRARVGHHLRPAARPHWHIDYLRAAVRLAAVWYSRGRRCEHEWAARIAAVPGAAVLLRGFGSSDCGCETHLYHFESGRLPDLAALLGENVPSGEGLPVYVELR